MARRDVFDANNAPGPPYASATTGSGVVLAHGGANPHERLTSLLADAGSLLRDPNRPIGPLWADIAELGTKIK